MDLHGISLVFSILMLSLILGLCLVLWLDDREDRRRRAEEKRRLIELSERIDAADTENQQRPRVRFPSPLPTKGNP